MAIITLDTGILLSAAGVIASVGIFLLKTYSTKAAHDITQSETVKAHDTQIVENRKNIIDIDTRLRDMEIDMTKTTSEVEHIKDENKNQNSMIEDMRKKLDNLNDRFYSHHTSSGRNKGGGD